MAGAAPAASRAPVTGDGAADARSSAGSSRQGRREPHHFNQALLLDARERRGPAAAGGAPWRARAPPRRPAAALHARGGRLAAGRTPRAEAAVPLVRGRPVGAARGRAAPAARGGGRELQASLDLAARPAAARVACFDLGADGPAACCSSSTTWWWTASPGGSCWRTWRRPTAARRGRGRGLPAKTTSFKRWARAAGRARPLAEALRRRAALLAGRRRGRRCRAAAGRPPPGGNTAALGRRVVGRRWSAEETAALLQEVPAAYRTQVNDVLLAALARGVCRAGRAQRAVLVDLEGHGREEIFDGVDLSRTVGWFTSALPGGAGPAGAGATPGDGAPGGQGAAARGPQPRPRLRPAALPRPSRRSRAAAPRCRHRRSASTTWASSTALRRRRGPSRLAPGATGGAVSATRCRGRHLLDVNALVLGGRLRVRWTYDAGRHRRATVERLAEAFLPSARGADRPLPVARRPAATPRPTSRSPGSTRRRWTAWSGDDRGVEDLYPLSPLQAGHALPQRSTRRARASTSSSSPPSSTGALDPAAFAARLAAGGRPPPGAAHRLPLGGARASRSRSCAAASRCPGRQQDWRGLAAERAATARCDDAPGRRPRARLRPRPGAADAPAPWCALADERAPLRLELPPPAPGRLVLSAAAPRGLRALRGAAPGGSRRCRAAAPTATTSPGCGARTWRAAEAFWRRERWPASPRPPRCRRTQPGPPARRRAGASGELRLSAELRPAGPAGLRAARTGSPSTPWCRAPGRCCCRRYSGRARRGLRRDRLRPARRAAGRRVDGRPVHQHACRCASTIPDGDAARPAWLRALQARPGRAAPVRVHARWPSVQALERASRRGGRCSTACSSSRTTRSAPAVAERTGRAARPGAALDEQTNYPLTLIAAARGELALRLIADRRFEPVDGRGACWPNGDLAGGARRRSRQAAAGDPAAARRGRAPPARGRVERHREPTSRRPSSRRCSRSRRRARPDAVAVELGDGAADLRRAAGAGQPARPPARWPWGSAPGERVACLPSARWSWSSPCWASSRPAAPTCRSTRPTRRSAWPGMSRDAGASCSCARPATAAGATCRRLRRRRRRDPTGPAERPPRPSPT